MQKRKKLGFFQKIFLAITDFRVYPYILKAEKLGKSFAHFITFLMIIIGLISFKYSSNVFNKVSQFIEEYDEIMPEFSIQSGELDVQYTDTIHIDEDTVAVLDTSYTFESYVSSEKYRDITKYDSRILITSDAITYQNYDGSGIQLFLSDIDYDYNKESFYEHIVAIQESSSYKVVIFVIIYISVFMVYGIFKFLEIFLYAIFASLVSIFYGIRVDFKNYIKIAIYIVTLPYILESIAILYTGALTDYAVLVSNALAYVYIFCAIKAVKVDAFMLLMNRSKRKSSENQGSSAELIEKEESQNVSKSDNEKNSNENKNLESEDEDERKEETEDKDEK